VATVILSRVSFDARHGISSAERRTPRRFEVDVELDADVGAAERSDRLADTIDYSVVAELIVDIGTAEPHHLLESVARRMVDVLFARFDSVRAIRLELRKLAPPACPGNPAYSAVRLVETR
jgi:dihydroneopterin aldolase